MTNVKSELIRQLEWTERVLEVVERRQRAYKNLEEGSLRVTKSNGCPQFHLIKKGKDKEIYIPTYEKDRIRLLAQRDYNEKVHKVLISNRNRLSKFIAGYDFGIGDSKNVYPDFVALNVRKRKTIYWEHLGLAGDISYATKNFKKLMDYEREGLILGDNLIITLETDKEPLDVALVEKKVHMFLQ